MRSLCELDAGRRAADKIADTPQNKGNEALGSAANEPFGVASLVANAVSAIVLNLLWGTIQPSLYIELRQAKEGGSLQNLEEVFA